MRMYDIISKKRDGGELSNKEIKFFIDGYTSGNIPDYQMSALVMAIFFKGMNNREIADLTSAMAHSGDMIDLTRFGELSVDKHSTGGVGDKTTLIVAPIVASLGGKVAKMSGRGLGHTGGTIDKLESIKGFRTELNAEDFLNQVENIGVAVVGQSGNLAPADKKLYALRDVTATVDSIPLIASSVMSKKIAAGSHSIVLDVKVGSGAFMKTVEQAEYLANLMVDIGTACGRSVSALITNMDIPLGFAIGNSLEVKEAISILKGEGCPDLKEVCVALATKMLCLCHNLNYNESKEKVLEALESGKAFEKFKEWIKYQGGDANWIENVDLFENANIIYPVLSKKTGYINHMDTEKIGIAGVMLGAGRENKGDKIDYSAGIILKFKTGDYVKSGEIIAELHTNKKDNVYTAEEMFLSSVIINDKKPVAMPLIYKII